MKNEKKTYLGAEMEVVLVSAQDIVTASNNESTGWVDPDGWDNTNT